MVNARKVAAALVVISHYKRKQQNKRKHRWWIKEIYRQRNVHANQLLSDMTFEGVEETIKNFTGMNSETFEDLCIKLESINWKKRYIVPQSNHNKRKTGDHPEVFGKW